MDKSVYVNFQQYGLQKPELMVGDASYGRFRSVAGAASASASASSSAGSSAGWLDAIVTDPPYGIRAKSKKVGGTRDKEALEKT